MSAVVPLPLDRQPQLAALLPRITAALAATAEAADAAGRLPPENFRLLHQAGLIGLPGPVALGGGGASLADTQALVHAVAKGEPATALILVMTQLFLAGLTRLPRIDPVRERVARDIIGNGALINALRVEPELGTPARGGVPATVARRVGDAWQITGRKIYSTGSPHLTWFNVWAVTDEPAPRVGSFLVHRSAPGWHIEESWDHLGLRASESHDVVLDAVPTPFDHGIGLLPIDAPPPPPDPGFATWSAVLTAGIYDAIAESARDWYIGWARGRVPANLGKPVASLPRHQEALGEVEGLLLANRSLLASASAGALNPVEAGLAKHLVTENAIQVVERLIALTGNPGLTRHNPLQRHLRDVLCGRVHTPQGDAVLLAAGRAAFGPL
jgi:alkylation response protein AidB-like acyl-CoA dehydrogenase